MDLSAAAIQAFLFALFAGLTAVLGVVIAPTYDNLLVPQLSSGALYPALSSDGGTGFLGTAASFSADLLTSVVDPAIALVALLVAGLYLLRAVVAAWRPRLAALLPKLIVAVLVANLTLPLTGAILGLAGNVYPAIAGWDGGAWQSWANIDGPGGIQYMWDNGAVAFVLTFVLFSLVLLLVLAVAVRNALLGVLLVLLPLFSILWPIPYLGTLARRGWLWFVELAFLPCAMVIPLELAVGSPSILLTMGYFVIALAAPALISTAGASLTQVGFPSAGGALAAGLQRGLAAASVAVQGFVRPAMPALRAAGVPTAITSALERSVGHAAPLALPAFTSEMLGHGSARLFAHLNARGRGGGAGGGPDPSWHAPPLRRGPT